MIGAAVSYLAGAVGAASEEVVRLVDGEDLCVADGFLFDARDVADRRCGSAARATRWSW